MMVYVLKSALLLTLLYGGFAALLSRETFHRFNRMALLSIMVLSLVLPVLPVSISLPRTAQTETVYRQYADGMSPIYEWYTPDIPVESSVARVQPAPVSAPSGQAILHYIYMIGIAIALLRFLWRGVLTARSLRGGLRLSVGQGNTLIVKGGEFAPFSFMHYIVMSVSDYEQHRQGILTHEQAHARLGHSWDVLLTEAVQVVQWFNPFAWLLGRELKAVHEYEADEAVICQGIDATRYQQLLVLKAVGNRLQLFARSTLVACFCKNTLSRGSLKQRINMMQQKKSNPWRMLRAAFAIPVVLLSLTSLTPEGPTPGSLGGEASVGELPPLVEYRTHQKWGKGFRDYYLVRLHDGVWIENNGQSYIEEQNFQYSFDDTKGRKVNNSVKMMLNGVPFDQNSLPKLNSSDVTKLEITTGEATTVEGHSNGNDLAVRSQLITVNIITTPVTIPAGVKGNVPRTQTLLLPGRGALYIKNGKAEPGDWMHCSVISWEPTSYGYSVRNEFERSKTKPGYKCYIYASTETAEADIARAEALMHELGITNYEVVRNLPKHHFTDGELRQWAQDQKARGTAFDKLYDAMAPNHMDCADVHRQWHIVKAVYGRK